MLGSLGTYRDISSVTRTSGGSNMWNFLGGIASGAMSLLGTGLNYFLGKRENEIIREREDNAVQRRAKDLEAAGLSKTLAAGSAATTSVTSAPQVNGNGFADVINAVAGVQGIKNAREENANLRKSREVMQADIGLKYGQMMREFQQANYFQEAAHNQSQDVLLKQEQANLFAQQILESAERSKTYSYSAQRDLANALLTALQFQVYRDTGVNPNMNGIAGDAMRRLMKNSNKDGPVFDYPAAVPGFSWNAPSAKDPVHNPNDKSYRKYQRGYK